MEWVSSNARQTKNYAKLFGTRAYALGAKYMKRGSSSFSTPRVPYTTPENPPTWWQNLKNTAKAFVMAPTCIFDTPTLMIYVGSAFNTASKSTYSHSNVTHVFNCADKEDKLPMFYQECIEGYYHLSLRDESDENASFVDDPRFHSGMRDFLSGIFTSKRDPSHKATLLVHCVFGRSRSVAICIIILFLYYQHIEEPKSMIECYEYIGKKRKVVALRRGFLVELNAFEEHFEQDPQFREKLMSIFN